MMLWLVFLSIGLFRAESRSSADPDKTVKRQKDISGVSQTFVFGKTYIFIKDTKTWFEARKTCQELKGDLAVLTSYKDYDALAPLSTNSKVFVWVGARLRDRNDNNKWFWVTGEHLSLEYSKWRNRGNSLVEPDGGDHDCAIIRRDGNGRENDGPSLADIPCSSTCPSFLCEIV